MGPVTGSRKAERLIDVERNTLALARRIQCAATRVSISSSIDAGYYIYADNFSRRKEKRRDKEVGVTKNRCKYCNVLYILSNMGVNVTPMVRIFCEFNTH